MQAPSFRRLVASTIRPAEEGMGLLRLLVSRFTYLTPSQWSQTLAEGHVALNGRVADGSEPLRQGDCLELDASWYEEPSVTLDFRICFLDDALLVVDKPANLPTHPAGPYFNHTLWSLLRQELAKEQLHIITRLDRETSGLVLVARTAEAARNCHAQMKARAIAKRYLAVVEGGGVPQCVVRGSLERGTTPGGALRMHVAGDEGARMVRTDFTPIHESDRYPVTLVEAIPHEGRLHQIRACAAAMGHPVVGDKLYGDDPARYDRFRADALTEADRTALRLPRQALHAAGLTFLHPTSGEGLRFESPLPSDMAQF